MVLAFVEHDEGTAEETSLEMLTLARSLASSADESVSVAAFGDAVPAVADELGTYGVDEVYHVVPGELDSYTPVAWGEGLVQLAGELDATAIVGPGSDRGQEVIAHVGASLGVPMAANCIAVDPGAAYEVTRQRWGGSLLEHARLDADPKLLTVAEHEVRLREADEPTEPGVEAFTPSVTDNDRRVRVDRFEEADVEGVPLGEARVVVSGGRGVGGPEGYDKLEELAELLGGTVGASRAAVNEGWRPHDDQVGLTGAKISPDIYIACGISGAIQHMVGCKGAKNILAINTDPEAAIMGKAEYAVVGDLHEVVPAIIEEIKKSS